MQFRCFVFDKSTCTCLLYLRYEINSYMKRTAQSRDVLMGVQRQGDERKSVVGSLSLLVGRRGVGQLLRAISQGARLVVGDLLAGWWRDELDHCALVLCLAVDARPAGRSAWRLAFGPSLDLLLRRAVGHRRPDLRAGCALSGHVAGHGRVHGQLRGLRHADT